MSPPLDKEVALQILMAPGTYNYARKEANIFVAPGTEPNFLNAATLLLGGIQETGAVVGLTINRERKILIATHATEGTEQTAALFKQAAPLGTVIKVITVA